eukprot:15474134-Alexandrium_andersonii.AAC.1
MLHVRRSALGGGGSVGQKVLVASGGLPPRDPPTGTSGASGLTGGLPPPTAPRTPRLAPPARWRGRS